MDFKPTLASHGNAKEKHPFHPTWPSTLRRVKDECTSRGPKAVVEVVSGEAGGVVGASAPGQLPRNEKQVSNLKRKAKSTLTSGQHCDAGADDLFIVMQRAHTQDPSNKFIRDVKTAPEPAIVLADDRQLQNIVRFCTSSFEFGVLTVDPTFSLGAFDVTPISYRHLLLKTRRYDRPPVFLGPVLIHYKKTFATYVFFASSLIGQNHHLQGVRVVGTDGERALGDAFMHEFRFSQHLLCFIHVRRNIKDKLSECNIPSEISRKIVDDIFGHRVGTVFQEGLVDSFDNDDYQCKLDALIKEWQTTQMPSSAHIQKFVEWFLSNKADAIRDTMLRPIREECGLGTPPDTFTTNASESINALLKHKVDYKRSELPIFIDKVKQLIDEQEKEVERAVINRGKYQFREQYQFLEVEESKWFKMNSAQRVKHLSKVRTTMVSDACEPGTGGAGSSLQIQCGRGSALSKALSLDVEAAFKIVNIPRTCLEGMWLKAAELLNKEHAIVPAPGQSPEAKMVLSYSGKAPHMVTPVGGGGLNCDANCVNWKSLGICSHSIAVAEINGKLAHFISFVQKKKKRPNLTNLTTTTMPRGRGRKGGVPPRKRKARLHGEPTRLSMCTTTGNVEQSISSMAPVSQVSSHSSTSPLQCNVEVNASGMSFVTAHNACSAFPCPDNDGWRSNSDPSTCTPFPSYPSWAYPYSPWTWPNMTPPPPTSMCTSSSTPCDPFKVCFKFGNISVCNGCRNTFTEADTIVIQHAEFRQFLSPRTGLPASRYGNAYYHARRKCIELKWGVNFSNSDVVVPENVKSQLTSLQNNVLLYEFGIVP